MQIVSIIAQTHITGDRSDTRKCYEETTDRQSPSLPPHYTTACDNRRIEYMAVIDRVASSRAIAQQIKRVCHSSFGVHSYQSMPFAAEWNVRKASIASFPSDWKSHAPAKLMGPWMLDMDNRME
ncbi:hypothetical protein TNCV_1186651 [Trichonephila clavipes]|nr:hypothetical protein TNCV_1186651 [Trichonephila clavipes]